MFFGLVVGSAFIIAKKMIHSMEKESVFIYSLKDSLLSI